LSLSCNHTKKSNTHQKTSSLQNCFWDNAASYSHASSLDQLSPAFKLTIPVDFGTQDTSAIATHIGYLKLLPDQYGVAFWGPSFQYTIISLGYLQQNGWNYHTSGNQLIISDPSGKIFDTPSLSSSNMLPVSNVPAQSLPRKFSNPSCLANPSSLSNLDAAEQLHQQYNHPSDQRLSDAIKNECISTTVTPQDIANNRKRGQCINCSNGKLRDLPHPPSPYPPSPRTGHTLVLDIDTLPCKSVGGSTVAIHCVDTFSTRYDVNGSPTKTTRDIFMAIVTIVATAYNAFRHLVEIIYTDSEAVFKALEALLGSIGIQLLLSNPIDHNRFFERYKQTLGMGFNSTLSALQYYLPLPLYLQLAADTAYKYNCLPNSKTGTSCPWTIVTGKKPSPPKGIFGQMYMVSVSLKQRQILAKAQSLPQKSIPKSTEALNLGKNPLWPSADQFLLGSGTVVSRIPRSQKLNRIPSAYTLKPIVSIPIPPSSDFPFKKLYPSPLSQSARPTHLPKPTSTIPTNQHTLNAPVQPTTLSRLQDILYPVPKSKLSIASPVLDFDPTPNEDSLDLDSNSDFSLQDPDDLDTDEEDDSEFIDSQNDPPSLPPSLSPPREALNDPETDENDYSVSVEPEIDLHPLHLPLSSPTITHISFNPSTIFPTRNDAKHAAFVSRCNNAPLIIPTPPTTDHPHPKQSLPPTKSNLKISTVTSRSASRIQKIASLLNSTTPPTPLTAISRKAVLKKQTMDIAKKHKKIANPLNITNSVYDGDLDDFELDPPNIRPDEIPLKQALKLATRPNTDPNIAIQINNAVNLEVDKLFNKFDTLRELTDDNPMEHDAHKIFSTAFVKFKTDGRITARLAGCGNGQTSDSYDETYASTSDYNSWVLIFASYYAAAIKNNTLQALEHCDFDVTSAFLNNRLPRHLTGDKQLVLKLPSCLPHRLAGKYVEVVGAIYGLKQSNNIFETDYALTLSTINFLPAHESQFGLLSAPDKSVYHYQDPINPARKCTVVMQVDDGQIFSTCSTLTALLKSTLESRYGPIKWNPVSPHFAGTRITHHPSGAFVLDNTQHVIKTLHKLGADNIPPAQTPASPSILLPSSDPTPTNTKQYQQIVGNLTYISRTRSEINFPLFQVANKSHSPTKGDLRHAIRILRYLKGFPETSPHYYTTEGPILCAHIDASYANQENGISTSCLKLTIGSTSAPFLSKTYSQESVALDPATSEYYSMSPDICKTILRYRNLLAAIGFPQLSPTPVYIDNQPAIHIATSPNIPRKSRYIPSRHHFVRNCVADHELLPIHKNTNTHIADLGTKPHGPATFHYLTKLTMNSDAPLNAPNTRPL